MFVTCPGQPTQVLSGAARVTSDPYRAGSLSMACGEMPKMIVFFKLTCHQSSAKEALLIGSNTMPSVLLVEVSGLRSGLPPTVIGNWVWQSFTLPVVLQRAGSLTPFADTPLVCG